MRNDNPEIYMFNQNNNFMTTTKFSFSESIKTPGKMQPCTPEMLNAAFDNQRVINTCREIANRLKEVKEGKLTRVAFKKVKTKLKENNLPVLCFHATFSDGYRHNQSAIPSGLSIYDVDELKEDPHAYYMNKVAGREEELNIYLAHISPSNEGVRLVFEMPKGMPWPRLNNGWQTSWATKPTTEA